MLIFAASSISKGAINALYYHPGGHQLYSEIVQFPRTCSTHCWHRNTTTLYTP